MRTGRSRLRLYARNVPGVILVTAAAAVAIYCLLPDYRDAVTEQKNRVGTSVLDREGRILRIFPDSNDRYCLWYGIDTFPSILKAATVAAEDHRFHYHPGFDPLAIVRAFWVNLQAGRTVSGASTISQQVVRLITPRPRTYRSKIVELFLAMKLELQLSKSDIMELYLNLSPMGSGIRGAALASSIYLGKDVARITPSEAAILAALPRSPSRYSPRRAPGRSQLIEERNRILIRMARLGYITEGQHQRALTSQVRFENRSFPVEAPHFVDWIMASSSARAPAIKTTIDLTVQQTVERVLQSHSDRLRQMGIRQAGAMVVSTAGAEVLAMVGSLRYGSQDKGFNNAALARRGAGSTLKPFLYALALERGYEAFSEIPDTFRTYPTPHGDYLPVNADRRSYGPVTVRNALGNSLNMAAVKMAGALGVEDFCTVLQRLDLVPHTQECADRFGLGIAIGNVEVTLYQLVQAYTSLARLGDYRPLMARPEEKTEPGSVFRPEAAYVISHILSDPSARELTFGNPSHFDFGFPLSLKTGTSSNHRDAWAIAYDSSHIIGLWAGNFDSSRTYGVSGSSACGPILKDLVESLYGTIKPTTVLKPGGVQEIFVCPISGKPARESCPHKTADLCIGRDHTLECTLPHSDPYHYLGGTYANWIHRREWQLGKGRYRLDDPVPVSIARARKGFPEWAATMPAPAARYQRNRIEIVSPHNRDSFVLSPYQRTRILFRAVPHPVVEQVTWFVDGTEIARTPPPYEVLWEPTRGRHVVHAVTPSREADQVIIHVE